VTLFKAGDYDLYHEVPYCTVVDLLHCRGLWGLKIFHGGPQVAAYEFLEVFGSFVIHLVGVRVILDIFCV
jgi:hypothetical protein